MTTTMKFLANVVDADYTYQSQPTYYIELDLDYDYLIWTAGSATVVDRMTAEPTPDELNEASTLINAVSDVTVDKCMVMDYSHSYDTGKYTLLVIGMGENKRYVFSFAFDDETATEPQLEAWDDDTHTSATLNVLGDGTPADSMVKAVCTTAGSPGASWVGTPIAGSSDVVLLNNGAGGLGSVPSGQTTQDLFANIKIVIPSAYSTPASEQFVLTVRYSWV